MILLVVSLLLGIVFGSAPPEYKLLKKFRETEDVGTALFLLENYPTAVFVDELRADLAQILYERGEPERAQRVLGEIDLSKVREKYGERIAQLWKALGLDPKPVLLRFPEHAVDLLPAADLNRKELDKVLGRLLQKRRYEDVLRYAGDLCFYRGVALYRLKRYRESIETLKECRDERSDPYVLLSYIRTGDITSAELFALKRDDRELYFRLGWLFLANGDYKRARKYIALSGENFRKFFYLAMLDLIEGKGLLAYENLSSAEKYARGNLERARVYFWKYKILKALGQKELSLHYLRKSADLTGFYATVAKMYLKERLYREPVLHVRGNPGAELASELKAIRDLGFPYYMRLEALKRIGEITPEDILELVKVDPHIAIKLAVRRFGANSDVYRAVAYPTPFRVVVKRASRRYSVPEALIYAVMRQESLFDPFAVSRSDAKGLMQLMDRTARWKAERIGYDLRDVFDIETNVLLGTAYLRFLLDYWKGDIVRAVASYNAGQGAVSRWINYRDDFLFIELIPFNETRTYVRRVLWFYYIYAEKLGVR